MNAEASTGSSSIEIVAIPGWGELPWLVHGFSTRMGGLTTVYRRKSTADSSDGELNLGFTTHDDPETVRANRQLLLSHLNQQAALRLPITRLVTVRQTHSAIIHRVDGSYLLGDMPTPLEGDGLMTDTPGLLLGILTADCVPVLVVDRGLRVVAAFHAGWRGTVQQIVEKGVVRMQKEFGSKPRDLLAAIGPAIGPCCYQVGEEVRQQFADRFRYVDELFDASSLKLAEANRRQLLAAGILDASITMAGACTSCHTDRFFSYRAERGHTGRMLAVIGVRRSADKAVAKESSSSA